MPAPHPQRSFQGPDGARLIFNEGTDPRMGVTFRLHGLAPEQAAAAIGVNWHFAAYGSRYSSSYGSFTFRIDGYDLFTAIVDPDGTMTVSQEIVENGLRLVLAEESKYRPVSIAGLSEPRMIEHFGIDTTDGVMFVVCFRPTDGSRLCFAGPGEANGVSTLPEHAIAGELMDIWRAGEAVYPNLQELDPHNYNFEITADGLVITPRGATES